MSVQFITADCLDWLREQPDDSVDLVVWSPPYEDARLYGELGYRVRGQEWVDWTFARFVECYRVCRGLVACVVEGRTKRFQYSASPILLAADLHRAGIKLRKPVAFHRVGIPGSGGPDWLRNDWEFVICASKGRLPYSDNTACGRPTKYDEGGGCTNRQRNGIRVSRRERAEVGSHRAERQAGRAYAKPKSGIANPGNVLHYPVGKGHMGHDLAHDNEAPFPLAFAEFWIKSFCPPRGTVLDITGGSGTVAHAAVINDRNAIHVDIRESQVALARQRIEDVLKNPPAVKRPKKRRRSKSQGVLFSE